MSSRREPEYDSGSRDGTGSVYAGLDRVATRDGTALVYAGLEWDPVSDGTFTYGRSPAGRVISQTDQTDVWLAGLDRHGDLAFLYTAVGVVTDTQTFDPFGDPAASTGTTSPTLGFQSDFTDPASGHVWMGTRWYDGGWASFLSRDTVFGQLRTPVSLNRYTYGFTNPLGFWDPDGRVGVTPRGPAIDGIVSGDASTETKQQALSNTSASNTYVGGSEALQVSGDLVRESLVRSLKEAKSTPQTASQAAAEAVATSSQTWWHDAIRWPRLLDRASYNRGIDWETREDVVLAFAELMGSSGSDLSGIADFMEWEDGSGRDFVDWWLVVNGELIADMKDAMAVLGGEYVPLDAGARAWLSVLVGDYSLEEMWNAHQVSLYEGIDMAWDEFYAMPLGEQSFVANSVVPNVGNTALSAADPNRSVHLLTTVFGADEFGMDDWLEIAYPDYPADGPSSALLDPSSWYLSWATGVSSFSDVGLDSARWRP